MNLSEPPHGYVVNFSGEDIGFLVCPKGRDHGDQVHHAKILKVEEKTGLIFAESYESMVENGKVVEGKAPEKKSGSTVGSPNLSVETVKDVGQGNEGPAPKGPPRIVQAKPKVKMGVPKSDDKEHPANRIPREQGIVVGRTVIIGFRDQVDQTTLLQLLKSLYQRVNVGEMMKTGGIEAYWSSTSADLDEVFDVSWFKCIPFWMTFRCAPAIEILWQTRSDCSSEIEK